MIYDRLKRYIASRGIVSSGLEKVRLTDLLVLLIYIQGIFKMAAVLKSNIFKTVKFDKSCYVTYFMLFDISGDYRGNSLNNAQPTIKEEPSACFGSLPVHRCRRYINITLYLKIP